jgi:hypothetical protein
VVILKGLDPEPKRLRDPAVADQQGTVFAASYRNLFLYQEKVAALQRVFGNR